MLKTEVNWTSTVEKISDYVGQRAKNFLSFGTKITPENYLLLLVPIKPLSIWSLWGKLTSISIHKSCNPSRKHTVNRKIRWTFYTYFKFVVLNLLLAFSYFTEFLVYHYVLGPFISLQKNYHTDISFNLKAILYISRLLNSTNVVTWFH